MSWEQVLTNWREVRAKLGRPYEGFCLVVKLGANQYRVFADPTLTADAFVDQS